MSVAKMSISQRREYDRDMKRAERSRYKEANLIEVTTRVPNNPEAIIKLRAYAKKLCK